MGDALAEKISNGIMNKQGRNELSIKHINVVNLYSPCYIHLDELEYIDANENDLKRCNVEVGDIFLTRSSLKIEGIAQANILLEDGILVFDDHIMRLKLADGFDPFCIKESLNHSPIKREFMTKAKTGTMTTIGQDDIASSTLSFPTKLEQTAIGSFFRTFDNAIALHQRKLDSLRELKRGYLQQMFPQAGERVPRIRFAGFSGDWQERSLGEVADIVRGASPRPIQDPKWFDEASDVGWLRISDVTEQDGRIYYLEQKISEAGQSKTRVLITPHIMLSIAATVGKPVINYVKTGVHDGFLIFLNPKFEQEFMFQWLEMFRSQWHKYGQPGSQVNLNSDLVKAQEILMPIKEEQTSIGNFFHTLDEQITAQATKFEQLKQLKTAYLQKMFI